MKIDKTVQGAADKISGLLNPQAGQSEPEKKQNSSTRTNTRKN